MQDNQAIQLDKIVGQDSWTRMSHKTIRHKNHTRRLDEITRQDNWTKESDTKKLVRIIKNRTRQFDERLRQGSRPRQSDKTIK